MPASNFQVAFIIQPANSKLIQTMHCYEKLSSLLGLACHPNMQDWELENANPDRLPEFIHAYQTSSSSYHEQHALMGLILASFNDYLAAETAPDPAVEHTVCALLEQQWQDFHPLVRYWSLIDEDMDDGFHITPIMRKLWTRHAKPQPG